MDRKTRTARPHLWLIVGIVLLYGVGMTIVFPLLPFLLGRYLPESQVVVGMGAMAAVYALCTFLTAPVFGALSDRYGRKGILVVSLLGTVVGYVLFGVGGSLAILFVGRIIDGLTAVLLPESLKPENRSGDLSWKSLNPFGHFQGIFSLKESASLIGGMLTVVGSVTSSHGRCCCRCC